MWEYACFVIVQLHNCYQQYKLVQSLALDSLRFLLFENMGVQCGWHIAMNMKFNDIRLILFVLHIAASQKKVQRKEIYNKIKSN